MSGGGGGGEKTEKPTAKKLKEGRKQGQVARSPDIGSWVGMLAASLMLPIVIRSGSSRVIDLLMQVRGVVANPDPDKTVSMLGSGLRTVAIVVAPLAVCTVLVAIAAAGAQGGIHLATKHAKPKFERLNLLKGIKRMFGVQTAWEAVKTAVKTAVLGLVLWSTIKSMTPLLLGSGALPLTTTLAAVAKSVVSVIRVSCAAGLAMAALDYLVARKRISKQLKMSMHEIKQEYKQSEGDPQLKNAIRSKQMAMSRNRMMSDVASADVVLVNPTHVAVALRYDPTRGAPRVVAKGAGVIAAKIRDKARENRVPLVEDVPLARALHKSCEVGQEIPPAMYAAVATVLAFVLALKAKGSAAGMHKSPVSSN
jgi:flagellar biosynthetic protein FlhB